MATFEQLAAKPDQFDHPKLRSWLSFQRSATTKRSYVEFRRQRDGLVYKPARLYFVAERADGTEFSDREPWDEQLNDALIQHGFKARNEQNEAERFGYMLEGKFQPLIIHFNDGFFNSVLLRYLRTYGYAAEPAIAAKLAHIHDGKPQLASASTTDCEQRIDGVLAGCIRQLTYLGYGAATQGLLAVAMAYYLDDRFTITSREALGW